MHINVYLHLDALFVDLLLSFIVTKIMVYKYFFQLEVTHKVKSTASYALFGIISHTRSILELHLERQVKGIALAAVKYDTLSQKADVGGAVRCLNDRTYVL